MTDDPRPLPDIAQEMEALTNGDPEASHARADELLLEAIARVVWTTSVDPQYADRIAFAFNRLQKWYA